MALRTGAGRDVDFSRRIDTARRALEGSNPGALDIKPDAEAEMPALLPRLALTAAERVYAADRL